jgi:hypothetical protein
MAYTIKQDDTYPALVATLSDANGPVDVTNATSIRLLLKGATAAVSGVMTKVTASAGIVSYDWQAADTAVPGDYKGEIEVTWPGPKVETFPNDSYFTVTVVADLN